MEEENININEFLSVLWKNKWLYLIILGVSLIVIEIYMMFFMKNAYVTTAKILIDSNDASISDFLPNQEVLKNTANDLNVNYDEITGMVKTSFDPTKKLITITISTDGAQKTVQILTKYEKLLKPSLQEIYGIRKFDLISNSDIPINTYNSKLKKNVLFDVAIITMLYVIYVFLLSEKKSNISDEKMQKNDIMVLGHLNNSRNNYKINGWVTYNKKQIDSFNRIMLKIELNKNIERPKTILFVDLITKFEANYVVCNLALSYAKRNQKVVIINTNPSMEIQEKELYNSAFINNVKVINADSTQIDNIDIMSRETGNLINELEKQFDKILIIGNPIIKKVDSLPWANISDATVITEEANKIADNDIEQAKKYVEDVSGKILGIIITKSEL